ncbi:MAG: RNA polymerase sigma-70 factor [Bacteroidota bacterium]
MSARKQIRFKRQSRLTSSLSLSINSDESFERIYNTHFRRLFSIAYGILKQQEKAEGIVHDVFLSLWERKDKITINESLEGYLVKATKLAVMEYMRTRAIRDKHHEIIAARSHINENSVELEMGASELKERIEFLVNNLPPKAKKVYRLSREEGKNNKEISVLMAIAEKTVESHLTKALSFLRSNLAEYKL